MTPESTTLDAWTEDVRRRLQLEEFELSEDDIHIVLDLARDAAHQVIRPAAPLTTFLLGVAVGRGASLSGSAARLTELALALDAERPGSTEE